MSGTSVEMRRTAENALSSGFLQHWLLPIVNTCGFLKCAILKIEFPRNKYTKEMQLRVLGRRNADFKNKTNQQSRCSINLYFDRQPSIKSGLCFDRGFQGLVMKCSISKRCLQLHRYVNINYFITWSYFSFHSLLCVHL